jgi:hypothetical protein
MRRFPGPSCGEIADANDREIKTDGFKNLLVVEVIAKGDNTPIDYGKGIKDYFRN